MPLRGLEYFSQLYKRYVKQIQANIYGNRQIMLPYPQYIVFYNGMKDEPERRELRLSEAFVKPEELFFVESEPCLECVATVININAGKNRVLTNVLENYRWEVREMFQDFDMEKYLDSERRDAYEDGLQDGERQGRIEATEKINKLTAFLMEEQRWDDFKKSVADQTYQNVLLEEYQAVL